ncbi:hypothetical protein GWI33_018765 [Rhynchophorus ferrugineus]|uniref:Uncharacterized protein n=1 Tax=Rhynchophorus ferrugineus TaxID=354439 RepID=A0A834HSR2_RHYFE|nr:hypothetical protein GWI33_018765 [Rhynchophorus ferrugineus]
MRRSAISSSGTKTYTPNNLEITGSKIRLTESLTVRKPTLVGRKTLFVDPADSDELYIVRKPCTIHRDTATKKPDKYAKKVCLKTAVRELRNADLINKSLKEIKSTSKAEDFERIFRSLCGNDHFLTLKKECIQKSRKDDDILEHYQNQRIYQEFFGQHYDYLEDMVKKAQDEDESH